MYPWLSDAIDRHAVVITASRRLARDLRAAFAAERTNAGIESWLTPPIYSLAEWCRRQVDAASGARAQPLVLDEYCSAVLWERCLWKHAKGSVPSFRGFLRQARDAWQISREWNVSVAGLRSSARSPDERLFASAAADFEELLEAGSWTDSGGLPWLVSGLLSDRALHAPKEVILSGFDRQVPALEAIIHALEAAGCKVHTPAAGDTPAQVRVASFEDRDAELRAAGTWARETLLEDPDATIAIIDSELQNDADRAARLVREGLAPGWQYSGASYRSAVDVSYGRKLKDYPAIAVSMLICRWLYRGLSTKEVSLLLRSKCVASETLAGRSRMELRLRKLPDRTWRAADLARVLRGSDDGAGSLAWFRGLDAVVELQADGQADASPAHWASRIDALLDAWSWPGTATLTSAEFQLVNRWRDLLNELAKTAIVEPRLRLDQAAERLASLAEDVIFQPEGEGGLVSLMGTLEAAGMRFDHLWVSGLHAGVWPPARNPSPLISRELQKKHGMPDATPADTMAFSRKVLHRLCGSAPAVVLSWPTSDGESELAASGFLDAIPHESYRGPGDPGWHAADFCSVDSQLAVARDSAPAVAAGEIVRGGAYTVQRQSVEPFAAFVYGRLGVTQLDPIEPGISPRLRGNVIHDALATLYADRPSQADIRSWGDTELERQLGAAIDSALAAPMRYADETLARLLSLERKRLFGLLRKFLAEELERQEYRVAEVEKTIDYHESGVRLELRIDRIDRLADGTVLVIDYKTGAPKNLVNREGDPLDLQLVVYADALEEPVGGIAIINVDSRSISYRGTGGSVEWDAANRDTWPERIAAWREKVHEALKEIAEGDVRINMLLKASDARPLAILSRLEELKRAD